MSDASLNSSGSLPAAATEAERQYANLASWHKGFPFGDQWAMRQELLSQLLEWMQSVAPPIALAGDPVNGGLRVVEIGSGGGRWTHRLHRLAAKVVAIDRGPASRMEIERVYGKLPRVGYLWATTPLGVVDPSSVAESMSLMYPLDERPAADYVWSYDTFVHFHPELFWAYVDVVGALRAPTVHLHWAHSDDPSQRLAGEGCFFYYSLSDVSKRLGHYGYKLKRTLVIRDGYGSIMGEFVCR